MTNDFFVERCFDLDGKPLTARFHPPARAPGGEFQCRWTLDWPHHPAHGYACGEDSVQSLMLAMAAVHGELVMSEAYQAGRITLWGQSDLDLPPTWAAGPLYQMPRSKAERPADPPPDWIPGKAPPNA